MARGAGRPTWEDPSELPEPAAVIGLLGAILLDRATNGLWPALGSSLRSRCRRGPRRRSLAPRGDPRGDLADRAQLTAGAIRFPPPDEALPSRHDVESFGSLAKVARTYDIVALEHAPRLVSGQLHGHAFRDASADEVADGRPAEVVQQPTGSAGLGAGRAERCTERPDAMPFPMEDVGAHEA